MSASPIQVFEYLLTLKNLTVPVVRDFQKYDDKYWWQSELPIGEGCFLHSNTKDTEAWLEVYKQVIEPSPVIPKELEEWIKIKGTEPDKFPQVYSTISKLTYEEKEELYVGQKRIEELKVETTTLTGDELSKVEDVLARLVKRIEDLKAKNEILFDAEPQRMALWQKWLDEKWKPWASDTLPKTKIQRLYGELFTLYQRLRREGDSTELVWGHGLLAWSVNDSRVFRPVLTTRIELLFDSKKGLFQLVPTSNGTILELDMLSNIDLPNSTHLVSMEHFIQDVGINPLEDEILKPFLNELAQTLSPNGKGEAELISGRGLTAESNPIIYNAPIIFLRSQSGRQWQAELKAVIEEIRNGHYVPETIEALVSVDVSKQSEERQETESSQWKPIGQELLFPLPANEDQKEIVRRLSKNIGVVVQGPPGTGKSHTIVNLIAHLLAHGKRVLVTSQTERALRVLGDMIRTKLPEIAPLCVSVMGGDARSVQELDLSVTKISEGLDKMNVDILSADITILRKEISDCKSKIARIKTELGRATEAENGKVNFAEQEFSPMQLAEWLVGNQEEYGWFPDEIDDSIEILFSDSELIKLYGLLNEISKEDVDKVLRRRPELENLPDGDMVSSTYNKLMQLRSRNDDREGKLKGCLLSPNAAVKATESLMVTERALATFELLSEEWLVKVLDDIVHGENRIVSWQELVTDCKERKRAIREIENKIVEFSLEISSSFDLRQVREDAEIIRTQLSKNGSLGFMFKLLTGKKSLYILDQFKINGSSLRTVEDIGILIHHIDMLEAKKRLVQKWNNSIKIVDGPSLSESEPKMLQILEKYIGLIEVAFSWKFDHLNALASVSEDIKPHGVLEWTNPEWLNCFKNSLVAYIELLEYNQLNKEFESFSGFLKQGLSMENAHDSWSTLYDAYRLGDGNRWIGTLKELRRLRALEPKVQELIELKKRLSSCAPRWTAQIEAEVRFEDISEPPSSWRGAWDWRRAECWLKKHFTKYKLEELYEQLKHARDEESRLIQTLVAKSTWLEQNKRTTDVQKRSLRSWVQTIRRIGKGTGKYAAKHQADAKKEMASCRGAVPVWIMPLNRVIENFKPSEEPFDVVIMDESSQCDLFALSALFRAKRAVIVGDDRQISPEGVGKDQSEVYKLIDRYLIDIPQRERFTLQDSLYDTALRVFPGQQIMLKEHFRCVPEIIQFSNDMFYGGTIEPLKVPSTGALTPPIVSVRVGDGYRDEGSSAVNEPEANSLVDKIVELCSKEEYENKTMGVISLQGKEQAYVIEQQLREKLGEGGMIDRGIICGDAYSFQGDERDVIFLSMVAAPNVRSGVLSKRSDEQRFNVAASRAKEQLWLFHSVDLKDLNPNCMRYHLLQYCLDPRRAEYEMEDAEKLFRRYGSSKLHKDIHKLIVARGYRAIPEFKVGTHPYRIDTVIEGMNARLAIEVDGDEWHGLDRWEADLERQMILERVGWNFWRVRGSAFYRDRKTALESLWTTLDAMGIQPYKN
ncbi:AAA domain-containing protein [Pelosinus propionicus]|uniref:Part of AAA domain-containing protein n=1 Tax=Pelosinus propionicus DSM 13327 TaxID=1123291 RepID=A0A1I4JV24_9FIRM|nr:AAA domain-containing protein [Pelosinus propionicus]SFL70083.1 Part of AAA domain-containing protein [Pelosinus propionicus DSM 13327]